MQFLPVYSTRYAHFLAEARVKNSVDSLPVDDVAWYDEGLCFWRPGAELPLEA